MKQKIVRIFVVLLTVAMLLSVPFSVRGDAASTAPKTSAKSYVLMDAQTGMVLCGNAAAVAVGGDIPTFLQMMNKRAAEIGVLIYRFENRETARMPLLAAKAIS